MKNQIAALVFASFVACGGVQEDGGQIPTIDSIEPNAGAQAGGTTVTLSGTGLDFGADVPTRVAVGSGVVEATVVDDSTITFTTPPGPEGLADVVVFHGGGATAALRSFTFAPLPSVRSIAPDLGSEGGTVTIDGTGFQSFNAGAPGVAIDGAALTDVTVLDDTTLTATLPARPGEGFVGVDVEVTTNNGSATLPAAFRFTRQGLLALTNRRSDNGVYFIDPQTADARLIKIPAAPISRATTSSTGEMFAVSNHLETGGFVALLGGLDPVSFEVSSAVELSVAVRGGDLEIDGDQLFYLDRFEGQIRTFDVAGQETNAAAVTLTARGAPTCIFRNDATSLFIITEVDGSLRTVNKTTGALAVVANLDGPAGHFCHAASRINNQVFVLAHLRGPRETRLMRLDTATGELTDVGLIRDRTDDDRLSEVDRISVRYTSLVPTPPGF